MPIRIALFAFAAFSLSTLGCGGGGYEKGKSDVVVHDDAGLIANLVSEAGDNSNTAALAKLFAAKPSPADLKRMQSMGYSIDGSPKVDGASATATVKMTAHSNGKELGAKEWTFAKEGAAWKIKSAPLP